MRAVEWTTAYLGLGANIGDRAGNIALALKKLADLPTIEVTQVSSLYETAPVGLTAQPDFMNGVAEVRTSLSPEGLLARILQIEQAMGRVRTERWGPRVIDLDILAYGECVIVSPGLTIPHPHLTERAFALVPLAEIAPGLVLPGETRTVKKIAQELEKTGNNWAASGVSKINASPALRLP